MCITQQNRRDRNVVSQFENNLYQFCDLNLGLEFQQTLWCSIGSLRLFISNFRWFDEH